MSDNTTLPVGTGGDTVRTIDRSGIKTQVTQIDFGGEAGPEQLVTSGNPLPVTGSVTVSNFPASQTISGTVTANQGGAPWTVAPDGTVWALVGTAASVNVSNTSLTVAQGTATNLKTQAEAYQGGSAVATGNALFVQPGTGASFTVAQGTATNLKTQAEAYQGGNAVATGNALFVQPGTGASFTVGQGTATNLKTQAESYQGGTAVGAANPLQVSLANTGSNSTAVKVDGTGGTFPVAGTKTNNNGAPGGTNLGVLPAIANAAAPSWTEGNQVGLSSDLAGNLRTQTAALYFPASTNNSTSAQLAAGATFTGTLETVQQLQAAQVEVFCDQPYTLYIYQYADSGGTKLTSTDTFTRAANVPFNENISLPGNYFKLALTNNGAQATTTLVIDTTFGIMATGPRTVTNLGNNRTAINEIGGTAVTTSSLPVQVTPQQQIDLNSNDNNFLFQQILQELRINNYLLQAGLNVSDDLDNLRADQYFNSYQVQ